VSNPQPKPDPQPVSNPQPKPDPQPVPDAQPEAGPEPAPEAGLQQPEPGPARLRMRRAPRYLPFGLTGAVIGVGAGVILALSFTAASNYSIQTITGYFAAILGLIGTVAGLGLAVLVERRR
jgi:outer membrane biosynthesis protein TonB